MFKDCGKKSQFSGERFYKKFDWFGLPFNLPLFFVINFNFLSYFQSHDKFLQCGMSLHSALFYLLTDALLAHSHAITYMKNV